MMLKCPECGEPLKVYKGKYICSECNLLFKANRWTMNDYKGEL